MSDLFAVVVLTGTDAFGHLTDTGQVIVLPAVPSLVRTKVNENAPEETPVKSNTNVQFPVRVAVTKLPLDSAKVADVPVFPKEYKVSVDAVTIGDVNVLFVKVSVEDVVTTFTPSIATTPAETLEIVVSDAFPNSRVPPTNNVFVLASNVRSASVAVSVIEPEVCPVRTTL